MFKFVSDDPDLVFRDSYSEALKWLSLKAGRELPECARNGKSFELQEVDSQPISVISMDEPRYWSFQIRDADKQVPRRTWITEVGILQTGDEIEFGCRLQCLSMGPSPFSDASLPGVVAKLAEKNQPSLDGRLLTLEPWRVSDESDVDELVDFLSKLERSRPVICVSEDSEAEPNTNTVLDTNRLARLTIGAAHVIVLTEPASYLLSDKLGKSFSVFNGAVRTYRSGFDSELDLPNQHPVALRATIDAWEGGGPNFERFLINQVLHETVVGVDLYKALPSFSDISAQVSNIRFKRALAEGATDTELLELALEETESLKVNHKKDVETFEGRLESAELDRKQIAAERDQARAECFNLRNRMSLLEDRLEASENIEQIEIPDSFDELEQWCSNHLSGRVQVLPRALKAASKSLFENPPLAYEALLVLRDQFVRMKTKGSLENKASYESALSARGLEDSASFSGQRAGEQGDEYRVQYNGRAYNLDRHLKGNNSRDERYGFRLYFFWDADNNQVVVGSFPGHLRTRAS